MKNYRIKLSGKVLNARPQSVVVFRPSRQDSPPKIATPTAACRVIKKWEPDIAAAAVMINDAGELLLIAAGGSPMLKNAIGFWRDLCQAKGADHCWLLTRPAWRLRQARLVLAHPKPSKLTT